MPKALLVFWLTPFCVLAQDQSTLPELLREPPNLLLALQAHGVGDQIYACQANAGRYTWILKGPSAKLFGLDGQAVGRHFAGPSWEAKDGSIVVAKVVATVPSPDSQSIPWLRLDVIRHDGQGSMSPVVSVQRLNTHGGKPPNSGCDREHDGTEAKVPYAADYYFYRRNN